MELDEYQRAVVESDARFVQAIGYPGTGKTFVLASRVALLLERGVQPEEIVVLTYTNSSCVSIRRSITNILDPIHAGLADRIRIHTYHAFCRELIDRFPEEVGLTSQWGLTDFLDVHNLQFYPFLRKKFRSVASTQKDKHAELLLTDFKAYDFDQALKFGQHIVDKRDIGLKHLIIDEFQDCTAPQWHLVRSILRAHSCTNLTVAGDPNQEIFNFQSDHLEHAMMQMRQDYPTTMVYQLRYNYRSTRQIIDTFEGVVGTKLENTKLIPTLPDGKEPLLTVYSSAKDEIEGIVRLVKQLLESAMYTLDDIAVLVRWNADAQVISDALQTHGIEVKHELGVRGFGVRKLTSTAITLMKWSLSPRDFYLVQLLKNRYHQFITDADLNEVLVKLDGTSHTLTETLVEMNPQKYKHSFITEFLPRVRDQLLDCCRIADLTPILDRAIKMWKSEAGSKAKPSFTQQDLVAWQNLERAIEQCHAENELAIAKAAAMEDINLFPAEVEQMEQRGSALSTALKHLFSRDNPSALTLKDGKITVSTIHSAKSNEWPVVILPSDMNSPFNESFATRSAEMNRRLQYVATSRARKELYVMNTGSIPPNSRNSFLKLNSPPVSSGTITPLEAKLRDPFVFKPMKAIRRVSRVVRV